MSGAMTQLTHVQWTSTTHSSEPLTMEKDTSSPQPMKSQGHGSWYPMPRNVWKENTTEYTMSWMCIGPVTFGFLTVLTEQDRLVKYGWTCGNFLHCFTRHFSWSVFEFFG